MFSEKDLLRFKEEDNIWLTTLGRKYPHLVPIWFIYCNEKVYLCTSRSSVKVSNILENNSVAFCLESGDKPLSVQGTAEVIRQPFPVPVIDAFRAKYDWNITKKDTYDCLVEIDPQKVLFRK